MQAVRTRWQSCGRGWDPSGSPQPHGWTGRPSVSCSRGCASYLECGSPGGPVSSGTSKESTTLRIFLCAAADHPHMRYSDCPKGQILRPRFPRNAAAVYDPEYGIHAIILRWVPVLLRGEGLCANARRLWYVAAWSSKRYPSSFSRQQLRRHYQLGDSRAGRQFSAVRSG